MTKSELVCARCDHPISKHCKGQQSHSDHKEDARMVPLEWRRGTMTCKGRHCLNPLCSCIEFVEGEA